MTSEVRMEKRVLVWSWRLRRERQQRGWSQERVAKELNISPKTVGRWERGEAYPSLQYSAMLCQLYKKTAQELGLVEEDIGVTPHESAIKSEEETVLSTLATPFDTSRVDWGEAPDMVPLRGRSQECAQLERWIVNERSHVVAVLGTGGIGKTTLAVAVVEQIQPAFDYVFWRSLQNAPTVDQVLQKCLLFLSDYQFVKQTHHLEEQLSSLMDYLRQKRCLLVLDNIETTLQSGDEVGFWSEGNEGYGRLIKLIGEFRHRSCLLLISREKPKEVAYTEGKESSVRSLHLTGLDLSEGKELLQDANLFGSDDAWRAFIYLYSGNPLALKIVSGTIREIFGGDIAKFLKAGTAVFGNVHDLMEQQFHRLSPREQEVMYWLAIEREAVSFDELREDLVHSVPKGALLKALESLQRRYMITSSSASHFTLQPAIMEYVTNDFIERVCKEIEVEGPILLAKHALMKAQAKDYIRESQVRLILTPIIQQLLQTLEQKDIQGKFKRMLTALREVSPLHMNYTAGNILNLLIQMQYDLCDYDFSSLQIWQVSLAGKFTLGVNFAHAHFTASVFTNTFDAIFSIAFNPSGTLIAIGTTRCEIRILKTVDGAPIFTFNEHADWVWSVAFSPNGRILASGGEDQMVRLWDVGTGRYLHTLCGHTNRVRSVAFSSDGRLLASSGEDQTIRLWDVSTGQCLNTLQAHVKRVGCVTFSPNGKLLASASNDQTIRLWDVSTGQCLNTLQAHADWVRSIAFSPDGKLLASGGNDFVIRIWNASTGQCLNTFHGHTNWVTAVAFDFNGDLLASSSSDLTIRLWDVKTGHCFNTLQGHTNWVRSIAFSPDGNLLVSGAEDQTVRFWDVKTGQCLNTLRGYINGVMSVAFSPDGQMLAQGNENRTIQLWHINTGQCLRTLYGHTSWVRSVAFSPDGQTLASGSDDLTIRLWDVQTGHCLNTLQSHTSRVRTVAFSPDGCILVSNGEHETIRLWDVHANFCLNTLQGHAGWVRSVVFSPDGETLVSAGEDQTIRLWAIDTGQCIGILHGHTGQVRHIAFSPAKSLLASCGNDQTVRLWDVSTGMCLSTLRGHTASVRFVAFSPDGSLLASSSSDHTVRLWKTSTSQCLYTLQGHTDWVRAVVFSPDGNILVTGSRDGTMKCWNIQTGICFQTLRSDRPYERMNIANITGVTEDQKLSLKALGAIEHNDVAL